MCNRYVSPDKAAVERAWHIGRHNQPKWATEVYPRSQGPFLRAKANDPWALFRTWLPAVCAIVID